MLKQARPLKFWHVARSHARTTACRQGLRYPEKKYVQYVLRALYLMVTLIKMGKKKSTGTKAQFTYK